MKYYVLIKPWTIYVKEGSFFEQQGGLEDTWGKAWIVIEADTIEHARSIGEQMREKEPERYR